MRATILSSSSLVDGADDDDDDDGADDGCGEVRGSDDEESENDERDRLMRVRSRTSHSETCEIATAFLSDASTTTTICVRISRRCLSHTIAKRKTT
jgi:hypothetical protein